MGGGGLDKQDNSDKLEKFTKNKKQKQVIVFSLIGLVLLVGAIKLYRTFALFEEKLEFNVLHGRVPEYTRGDLIIKTIIDGEESDTIPGKNEGYIFKSVTCDNDVTSEWDNEKWGLYVGNLTKSKTTCTLVFKSSLARALANCNKDAATCLLENSELDEVNLAYDGTVDNNLRYIGANPNNYVLFNYELWRIIGVMNNITDSDKNVGSHIKIIRNESIGNYYWSGSETNKNNDWIESTLNTGVLNGTYYNGLTNESKNMISNVVWNLGVISDNAFPAETFYTLERGNEVYENNPITWTGRIGLMYPSDFGFAVGGNVRETCLTANLGIYNSDDCYTNDWLYLNGVNQWTLTSSGVNKGAFYVYIKGKINYHVVSNHSDIVRPALYLNSNIEIIADEMHDGSEEHPYVLK